MSFSTLVLPVVALFVLAVLVAALSVVVVAVSYGVDVVGVPDLVLASALVVFNARLFVGIVCAFVREVL